jgi:hypothetical protein
MGTSQLSGTADHQIEKLLRLERVLVDQVSFFGLRLPLAPAAVGEALKQTSPDHLTLVEKHLISAYDVFRICAAEKIDPWNDREFFVLSMRSLGLTYPSDFLSKISDDDVIEAYDMNRFQVFRNMRFMEKTGYSLLEIMTYEWPLLFDRSTAITNQMINYCDEILWTANKTIAFNIPSHYLRELRSPDEQLFEINFRYLSPLFSGPDKPYGLVGTCKVQVLESTQQKDNLAFV